MLFISYREGFWSDTRIAEGDAIRDVPLGGTGTERPVDEQELADRVRGKRLLLLVHGYNNERDNILEAYAHIAREMQLRNLVGSPTAAYDEIVGVVWPGGRIDVSYIPAKLRANAIADMVFARLRRLAFAAEAIDVNTHSLGARVLLKALQNATPDVPPYSSPNAIRLRNVWLTAAAVDDESIEKGRKFYVSTQACGRVYILFSKEDEVLKYFFPLGDFDRALGYHGPEHEELVEQYSPNVRVVDATSVVSSHGDYRKSDEVYDFYLRALAGAEIPQFSSL